MDSDARPIFTEKAAWNPKNMGVIAQALGFVVTPGFSRAYDSFVKEVVTPARVTDLLFSIAIHHFGNIEPPLKRTD